MTQASRFQFKSAKLKIKFFDNKVSKKGFELKVIRLKVSENRHGDKEYTIENNSTCRVFVEIPGNELQSFQGQRDNNDAYNSGVSVYNLIPIKAWTTSDCLLSKDDILLYKILRYSMDNTQDFQVQALQVSNVLSKATNTILYNDYIVAPYTFNSDEYPAIKKIIEDYRIEPIDLGY